MYLSDSDFQSFKECSMRSFAYGEKHITRIFGKSVLILMLDGVLRFTEAGKDIELRSGEYYIQKQGLKQEGLHISDMPKYFYIHFDGIFSETGGIPIRGRFSHSDISNNIQRLEKMYFSSNTNRFALNGQFYNILGSLNPPENRSDIADEIENYILAHFKECSFSLNDIKNKFHFSEEYIIKIFSKKLSKTPYKYITSLRIAYAKQLINSTARSFTDIAFECGYNDYSVFYKSFLRETGTSPRKWRIQKIGI